MASSREDQDLNKCYELGVNADVVKPLSFHEFICILRDRLRGLSSRPLSADTAVEKFKRCVTQHLKDTDI